MPTGANSGRATTLRYKQHIPLLIILLVACAARFTGIGFGLPHTLCRPDESTIVDKAWFVFQGDPNPHFFNYPSLFIYLLAALFTIRFSILALCGVPTATLNAELYTNPAPLFLTARLLSAALGSLTVLAVYLLVKRIFDKRTALLSAVFMSICYLHARDSHFGTTDVPMTCLAVWAVLFMLRSFETGRLKNYIRAGIFTGLATSTKYGGMFLVVAAAAACFLGERAAAEKGAEGDRRGQKGPGRGKMLICYAGAAAVAFFLTTPFALLDFGTFFAHFTAEARHLAVGETIWGEPMRFGRGWWYHARYTLPYGLGIPMFVAGVAGICVTLAKDVRKGIVLMAFPLVFYAVAGRGYTVFVRYMIPVLPFLCIGAAAFCAHLAAKLPTPAAQRCALALLAFILAAGPLSNVLLFDTLISRRDNRLVVHDWLRDNLPAGSTVYQTGKPFGHALLPPTLKRFRLGDNAGEDLPDYLIVHRHPLAATRVHDHIEELVRTKYEPAKTFEALDTSAKGNWYDRMDAFYLPLKGFRGIRRPGPNTEIHARLRKD